MQANTRREDWVPAIAALTIAVVAMIGIAILDFGSENNNSGRLGVGMITAAAVSRAGADIVTGPSPKP